MKSLYVSFSCKTDSSEFGRFSNMELPFFTIRIYRSDDSLSQFLILSEDSVNFHRLVDSVLADASALLSGEKDPASRLLLDSLIDRITAMEKFLQAGMFGTISQLEFTVQSTPSH
jgi:hypothetical protein